MPRRRMPLLFAAALAPLVVPAGGPTQDARRRRAGP
jgi:hypothetical protein